MINKKNRTMKGKVQIVVNEELIDANCIYEYDLALDQSFTHIHICEGVDVVIYNDMIVKNDKEIRK